MKKIMIFLLAFTFLLSGCSSYAGKNMQIIENNDTYALTFTSFKGTCVFNIKSECDASTQLRYNASLNEGTINVYIDGNKKELLFTISGIDSFEGVYFFEILEEKVKIIIESQGKCVNGSFSFYIDSNL